MCNIVHNNHQGFILYENLKINKAIRRKRTDEIKDSH